jgi:hypothetical protein
VASCIVVKAGAEDINHVAANLRPEHVREIRDTSAFVSPFDAVWRSADDSTMLLAGRFDGEAAFLLGAGRTRRLPGVGTVWMLATPAVDRHPVAVAVTVKRLWKTAHGATGTGVVEQFLPAWYSRGIRFLEWLGWETTREGNPHRRRGMVRMIQRESR